MVAAKDIKDADMLSSVVRNKRTVWALIWDIEKDFVGIPRKVVLAKLRQLLKRGLVTGCPCGCRGDWQVIEAIEGI